MQDTIKHMIAKASECLKNSYSPYSNFAVGACIRTVDNKYFCGTNVENVSYGLTVCAETSAITQMVSQGYQEIAEVVILSSQQKLCPPCGACRQRILEFASSQTVIHLCNTHEIFESYSAETLLPNAFTPKSLKEKHHD